MTVTVEKWGRVAWIACLTLPAAVSGVAMLVVAFMPPAYVGWRQATAARWIGLATPICLGLTVLQWLVAPPVTWRGKAIALLCTVVTVVVVNEWLGLFVYFFG